MERPLTWSIVAHDADTESFEGAVAMQSVTNRYLGAAVLDMMARGLSPEAAIVGGTAADAGRELRQVHAIHRHGRTAARTGEACVTWCGRVAGPAVSVAGNMLANDAVVPAMPPV